MQKTWLAALSKGDGFDPKVDAPASDKESSAGETMYKMAVSFMSDAKRWPDVVKWLKLVSECSVAGSCCSLLPCVVPSWLSCGPYALGSFRSVSATRVSCSLLQSAQGGYIPAMLECGDVYAEALFNEAQDHKEAFSWSVCARVVCLGDYVCLTTHSGLCCCDMVSDEQVLSRFAPARYLMAAKLGEPAAMLAVGKRTLAGIGTTQDTKEGQDW